MLCSTESRWTNSRNHSVNTGTYILSTLWFALPHWTEGKKPNSGPIQPSSSNELLSMMTTWKWTMCHIWKPVRPFLQITNKFDWSQNKVCLLQLQQQEPCCSLFPSLSSLTLWASSGLQGTQHCYRTFIFQNVLNQQSFSNNSSVPHEKATPFAPQHFHETLLAALHTAERNKNDTNPMHAVLLTFIKFSFWIPKHFIFVSEDIIMDIELVWNRSLQKRNMQRSAYMEYQQATKGWTTDLSFGVHTDILQ